MTTPFVFAGAKLRLWRQRRGLSLADLGSYIQSDRTFWGVSPAAISRIELGHVSPFKSSVAWKIADYLFGDELWDQYLEEEARLMRTGTHPVHEDWRYCYPLVPVFWHVAWPQDVFNPDLADRFMAFPKPMLGAGEAVFVLPYDAPVRLDTGLHRNLLIARPPKRARKAGDLVLVHVGGQYLVRMMRRCGEMEFLEALPTDPTPGCPIDLKAQDQQLISQRAQVVARVLSGLPGGLHSFPGTPTQGSV